jgi:hypothetical protein
MYSIVASQSRRRSAIQIDIHRNAPAGDDHLFQGPCLALQAFLFGLRGGISSGGCRIAQKEEQRDRENARANGQTN